MSPPAPPPPSCAQALTAIARQASQKTFRIGPRAVFAPILILVAAIFLLTSVYFAYARHQFAADGGDVQEKVHALLLDHLDWNGEGQALDIGCGNGALTIALAQTYSAARVTGIDYWGAGWEYSKRVWERNAALEGVESRVLFQKASASALPFEDEAFDAVVGNLVFHEVKDATDKRVVVRESLRVLKKGGRFAFQDLFLVNRMDGPPEDLVKTIRAWGIQRVEFVPTRDAPFIPRPLKLPFMVGSMGILAGEK